MKHNVENGLVKTYFCIKNNIVNNVSEELMNMIQYSEGELIGRTFDSFCGLLKLHNCIHNNNFESKRRYYIFTKKLEPREVTIYRDRSKCQGVEKYYIKEIKNSRYKTKLLYANALLKENKLATTILSHPDLIVLDINQIFLDILYTPYHDKQNSLGRTFKYILPEEYTDKIVRIIEESVEKKQTYFSERLELTSNEAGKRYYDASFVQILINDKVKYIVNTVVDVTEQVNANNALEEKNKLMATIIENISDAVLIFDKKGKPIVLNEKIKQEFPEDSLNKVEVFARGTDNHLWHIYTN